MVPAPPGWVYLLKRRALEARTLILLLIIFLRQNGEWEEKAAAEEAGSQPYSINLLLLVGGFAFLVPEADHEQQQHYTCDQAGQRPELLPRIFE